MVTTSTAVLWSSMVYISLQSYLYNSGKTLRLNTKHGPSRGLVQARDNGQWVDVCRSGSKSDELARVVCQEMGFANGITDTYITATETPQSDSALSMSCDYDSRNISDCVSQQISACLKPFYTICGDLKDCGYHKIDGYYRMNCSLHGVEVFKCWNTSVLYTRKIEKDMCSFSNQCPPTATDANYQGCGCPGVKVVDGRCDTIICQHFEFPDILSAIGSYLKCDGYYDCVGKEDEKDCNNVSMFDCINGPYNDTKQSGKIPWIYRCDTMADCKDGADEVGCSHGKGVTCSSNTSRIWLADLDYCESPDDVRDMDCINSTDFFNCSEQNEKVFSCHSRTEHVEKDISKGQICQYPNMTFVDGFCDGYIDQMNCTDVNTFTCPVVSRVDATSFQTFLNTRIRIHWTCDEQAMCDDKGDEWCFVLSEHCHVHKHQLCDGIDDCTNREDELLEICSKVTHDVKCIRRYVREDPNRSLSIPLKWLCDGEEDCMNGVDEDAEEATTPWYICGSGAERKCYPKTEEYRCDKGFVCPDKENTIVSMEQLCNFDESCGGSENVFCQITKELSGTKSEVISNGTDNFVPPCIPGLLDQFPCSVIKHQELSVINDYHRVFVLNTTNQSCMNVYGEQYAIMEFEGLCEDHRSPDYRTNTLELVSNTQCVGNNIVFVPDKAGTVQKFLEGADGIHDEHIFVCDNKNCVEKSNICDLIDDCGDGSDEAYCSNSFKCRHGVPEYIKRGQMCNQVYDCADFSDECNAELCELEEVIGGAILKACTFLLGSISVLVNTYMVFTILRDKKILKSRSQLMNLSMVLLIALGDFSVGLYLINIFSIDQALGKNFCLKKFEWLTSPHCEALGVISTFGTELSIFTMTFLSLYRMVNIRSINGRARVTTQNKLVVAMVIFLLILVSLIMSTIPILSFTEDYFTNGMYYQNNSLFNNVASLEVHKEFILEYAKVRNNSDIISASENYDSWQEIRKVLTEIIFTKNSDPKKVLGKSLKFYGSDSVCLFKYFVTPRDPQFIFSLTILGVNLTCFTIISITYIAVIFTAQGSSSTVRKKKAKDSRSNQLQTKITMMIATNVFSWMPFGIICLLHACGRIDATPFYKISSIIFIPINSCVNPIIYSNIVLDVISYSRRLLLGQKRRLSSISMTFNREVSEVSFASTLGRRFVFKGSSTETSGGGPEENKFYHSPAHPVLSKEKSPRTKMAQILESDC